MYDSSERPPRAAELPHRSAATKKRNSPLQIGNTIRRFIPRPPRLRCPLRRIGGLGARTYSTGVACFRQAVVHSVGRPARSCDYSIATSHQDARARAHGVPVAPQSPPPPRCSRDPLTARRRDSTRPVPARDELAELCALGRNSHLPAGPTGRSAAARLAAYACTDLPEKCLRRPVPLRAATAS